MNLPKIRSRVLDFIQYLIFRAVCFLVNLVPFPLALELGRRVGHLLFYLLGRYRKVALENLEFAFGGEKSKAEIKEIAIESFENLGLFGSM